MPSRGRLTHHRKLLAGARACLDRAVERCLDMRRPDGSWEALPDPRIFETALAGFALAHTPGDLDAAAVSRARAWVAGAAPQSHSAVAQRIEEVVRRILLGEGGVVDLTAPELDSPVLANRALLLHALALHAGLEVRARVTEEALRRRVAREYEQSRQSRLKQWSQVELTAIHVLLQARAGDPAALATAGTDLVHAHASGQASFNPVSSALAYLALCVVAPGSDPWRRARARLLADQRGDGTWRFCTSDVWDTSLIVRAAREHPTFAALGLGPALDFLQAAQSCDGGWPFRAGVESDNDTTGAVMLALCGTPQGERTAPAALKYLARLQLRDGLWRTWQSREDPPVEDVVAHVVSALDAHPGQHEIPVDAAKQWLAAQYRAHGRWAASWYRGAPYAVAEVSRALGPSDPLVRAAVDALAEQQNPDGGWGPEPGHESTASATGLALGALLEHGSRAAAPRALRALAHLIETQRDDGTWPGCPDMFGPRPLLSHFVTHTQAFVIGGLMAAL